MCVGLSGLIALIYLWLSVGIVMHLLWLQWCICTFVVKWVWCILSVVRWKKKFFFFLSCHRRHHHHSCVDISVPLGQRCLYLFITPFISATAATAAIVSCHKNHSKLFFLFKNIFETVKNIFLQYPNFSLLPLFFFLYDF